MTWIPHNRGPQPAGLEDCTVDAVGTDGGMVEGWWPRNVVWENVVSYRICPEEPETARITALENEIGMLREKLSDALAANGKHWSDCAVYGAPAEEPGPCDCGREA